MCHDQIPFRSNQNNNLELVEDGERAKEVSLLCLMGKVLGPKVLNKNDVSSILSGALTISPWSDNTFIFRFSDGDDRDRILNESPWLIMGYLLVLKPLSKEITVEDSDFRWCPFWIHAHGLPFQHMTKKIGEILENRIGSYLRFRVKVDTHEPFPRGFWLKRSQGEADIWINFKCEKLSDICYDYGRVGHDKKICKFVSKEKNARSRYGLSIRARVAKNLGSPYVSHHQQTDISKTSPSQLPHPNTIQPTYFVDEPPDSPSEGSPPSLVHRADEPSTEIVSLSQNPSPLPQSFGPPYFMDLCMSRALQKLSLKRKAPEDSDALVRHIKLLKEGDTNPLLEMVTQQLVPFESGATTLFRGRSSSKKSM
ncbi:hypothetical protein ACSBR1_025780 [Camellia fascicularis]